MKINYHGRKFRGTENTANGQVSGATVFTYSQSGSILQATYSGGSILQGQMLGVVHEDNRLSFLYHHIDSDGHLRNGYCRSIPELLPDGGIRLHEKWEWSYGGEGKGESVEEEF